MRVGLVIYGSLDTISGGYLYDRYLVQHLEECGDRVDIISLPAGPYARHLADNFSGDVAHRMSGDYDVLLQDELNHPSLAWVNGRLGRARPPVVAIVHHLRRSERRPGWQNFFYSVVERQYLQSVDGFVFNSQTTRREVNALVGPEGRPGLVAYPGGDRLGPRLSPLAVRRRAGAGPLRLLFLGNLIPRKGLHVLLAALSRVRADWRLSVVGNPEACPAYTRRIHELAARAGVADRVTWRGALPDRELAGEMETAHAVAVPSSYEGFGIVYVEGMGFGLPAIATRSGAAGEIVTHGETGYLIAPGDAAALAAAIELLAGDRALLGRMGEAALERYARHPTWSESMAAIRHFLIDFIGGMR